MSISISTSASCTAGFAAALGRRLRPNDVVLLRGPLGAGKTTFVQGIAEGMGLAESVTSPTFTLVHEYRANDPKLIHVDLYRLENPEQIVELGFDEWPEQEAVLVVEWAERLGPLAPNEHLLVTLEILGQDERRISLEPSGARWEKLVGELENGNC